MDKIPLRTVKFVHSLAGGIQDGSEKPKESQSPQSLEWITHNDAHGRRRARAHVTRSFRRDKAAKLKAQKESRQCIKVNTVKDEASGTSGLPLRDGVLARPPHLTNEIASTFSIQRGLGSDRIDPFLVFPLAMNPTIRTLINHFFFDLIPDFFKEQPCSDFQPVKALMFNVTIPSLSACHLLLSGVAFDMAMRRGTQESTEGIKHHAIAIRLVNEAMKNSDLGDNNVATVALFVAKELLYGTPRSTRVHLDGLGVLVRMRGGLESIRKTNPELYSLISWFDYAGSCQLMSRRQFCIAECDLERLCTPSNGVPEAIIKGLPLGFDLYREISRLFEELQILTCAIRNKRGESFQSLKSSLFITRIDNELFAAVSAGDVQGNHTRRRHIHQAFNTLALIYAIVVSGYEVFFNELFLFRLGKMFSSEYKALGIAFCAVVKAVLAGEDLKRAELSRHVSELVDECMPFGWEDWRTIKLSLLDFLVYDVACQGELQTLWRTRYKMR